MTTPRYVVGIDYSMACPACVMLDTSLDTFQTSHVLYVHTLKKKPPHANIVHIDYPKASCSQERFAFLAESVLAWLKARALPDSVGVWMEDYAFNAVGKVFHIGENGGVLKHVLWKAGYAIDVIAPAAVKKFATGRGNADKHAMYLSFVKDTGVDLRMEYASKAAGVVSPFGDIADAYWIAKFGAANLRGV